MNQGKLEVVKQEMARVNINILGISELKWTGMGEFNSPIDKTGEGNGKPLQYLSTYIKSPHGNYTNNETYEIKLYQSVLSKLYCGNKQPWKILVSEFIGF